MILSRVSFIINRKYILNISLKVSNGIFSEKSLELSQKGALCMEIEDFADIYMEIANAVGAETAIAIYELFKGQQILFPQKLYKKEYIYRYVKENYNGRNVRELAQKFGYSDRRIRQILSEGQV